MVAEAITLHPIGTVHSSLKDRAAAPMQGYEGAPRARIDIRPSFLAAADGIEEGAQIILLTWLDRARRDTLRVHPRSDPANPLTGVFATRSPDRPNPIGLHRVRVLGVGEGWLEVEPLEALDGTPVLDIKPVLRKSDDR